MSTFNWIVFAVYLFGIYASVVLARRCVEKKWLFKVSLISVYLVVILGLLVTITFSDMLADSYVKRHVEHIWQEQVITEWVVEDVKLAKEQEASYFFGIGSHYEHEVFRYTVLDKNGIKTRDYLHAKNALIMPNDTNRVEQKIQQVRKVRNYKNKSDYDFYKNSDDKSSVYYKVYLRS